MKRLALAAVSALAMVATAPASAAVFNFTYTGTLTNGGGAVLTTGQLTTTDTTTTVGGRQAYTITGITGARNGVSIAALAPAFPTIFGGADNLLFTTGTPVSDLGFSFRLANNTYANIFLDGLDIGEYFATNLAGDTGRTNALGTFVFSPAVNGAIPEPATWGLMLLGFGMVGAGMRSRKQARVTFA